MKEVTPMFAPKRILVPVDFSEPSTRALMHAIAMAEQFGASLDVLHVVPNPYVDDPAGLYLPLPATYVNDLMNDARKRLDDLLDSVDHQRLRARPIVKAGDPLRQVVEYARDESMDLIVLGTHGRSGVAHLFLGSVAERVVRTAPCPVLTVR
jgi:nucleotide-binding universal stress UspA family protein